MDHLFSICIPTYKRIKFIKDIIEVIPSDISIFISDNGNYIPDEFAQNKNVNISHLDNVISMFDNFNRAISLANTPWILLPGDDDVFVTKSLCLVDDIIKDLSDDVSMVIFGHNIIDDNDIISDGWKPKGRFIYEKGEYFNIIKYGVPARLPSILFNKEILNNEGGFDPSYVFTAGDSYLIQNWR